MIIKNKYDNIIKINYNFKKWKKYLLWDEKVGVYAWANINADLSLDKKWISNLNAEWYLWANYKKIDWQVWVWHSRTFWWESDVLKFANWSNNYFYWKANLSVTDNFSAFMEVRVDPNSLKNEKNNFNDRSQMSAWFRYNF